MFFEIQEEQIEAAGLEHGAALIERCASLELVFVKPRPLQVGSKGGRIVFIVDDGEKEKRPANSLDRGLACIDVVLAVGRLGSRHSVDAISEAAGARFGPRDGPTPELQIAQAGAVGKVLSLGR